MSIDIHSPSCPKYFENLKNKELCDCFGTPDVCCGKQRSTFNGTPICKVCQHDEFIMALEDIRKRIAK